MMWTAANSAVVLPTAATLFLLVPFLPRDGAVAVPVTPTPATLTPLVSTDEVTYNYGDDDKVKLSHVGRIIDALESLGILSSPKRTCYKLDRITKTRVTKDRRSWKIGIFLYLVDAGADGTGADGKAPGEVIPGRDDASVDAEADGEMEVMRPPNNCFTNKNTSKNSTDDSKDVALNRSRKSDGDSEADSSQGPWVDGVTDVHFSKTQIMVIVTCSTVIGTFFITAFFLRLRNYLKRAHRDENSPRSRSMAMFGGSTYYSDSAILKA